MLGRPVRTAAGALVDVAIERLNPAAQHLLQRSAYPNCTFLDLFGADTPPDVLHPFLTSLDPSAPESRELVVLFAGTGRQRRLRLAAQPIGEQLLFSFQELPAAGPPELPLAEQHLLVQALLAQAPVAVCLFQGDNLRIAAVNELMATLWGSSVEEVLHKPLLEAVPQPQHLGFGTLLRQVLTTKAPVSETEVPVTLPRNGELHTAYYNFVYQPLFDAQNRVMGVIDVATDVTGQVRARQQIERLNQELETRVQQRTQQLEQQQQRLQQMLGQAPAAVATLSGPEHRYTFANAFYHSLVGKQTIVGRTVSEVLPELVEQGFLERLHRVRATGQPFVGRETALRLYHETTGEWQQRYLNFVYQPLRVSPDQDLDIMVFAVDVTEQVQMRQQLEQLNLQLEARVLEGNHQAQQAQREAERQRGELWRVFEQAPLAIAVYRGPHYIIELANPTVARLWGRTQEQLIGKGLFEALPEVAGMGYEELLDNVMATGVPHVAHAMEAQHDRNGRRETVYWDFVYVPMYEADGSIYGAMVVATEVTEQVQARQQIERLNQELETRVQQRTRQLEQQQQLLRQILRQVPAAIATLGGPEHRFTFFNEPYQLIASGRTVLGHTVLEVFPEVAEQGFVTLLDHVYATGQPHAGQDVLITLYNAESELFEPRYIDFVYQPLFNENGQTRGILAFILDVTDKVGARQQVQRLNQELAATNETLQATNQELHATNTRLTRTNADLDTFVYTASHDLKAPIANIEGLLDALREYLPPTEAEPMIPRLLAMMQGAVTRFRQTVGHLTDVSRLQYGQTQPAEAIVLATIIEDVRQDLAPLLESTGGRLELALRECPTVYFPTKDLRSILYNLLSNALKYHSPERPPLVQVRASCTDTHVHIAVTDNGLGLNEQQQSKLFMLFRRLHNHVDGSGVGLFMIKRIIENAGGTITVQSQPEVGSTFLVTLPRS
ncbi:PAS domain-containing sensor histidine kinase [Hymenobacter sp. 102]|uniref:PAS domain-containing sensor histidine kinase n=1 Tax=Hymenobacter sp. 102 TaxID=3403152 RepID=UPI003CF7F134